MTEEVAVVEASEANDAADFEAGFNAVRGEEPPAHEEPVAEEPPAEQAEPEAAPEPEDAIIPGLDMPASQVRALLAKAAAYDDLKTEVESNSAKIYGKFGEVQRSLNQYKELQEEITSLKQNGNRAGSLALSAQADKLMSRVKAEYPELGELLAQDLSELSGGQSQEMPDVNSLIEQRMGQVKEEIEVLRLDSIHPDWREVNGSPEFALWKSGLKPETRSQLESSMDARFIAKGLSAFKEWQGKAKAAASNQNRLEKAVTPNGIPSSTVPTKTPEQEFAEGFNAVRSRKL